MTDKQTEATRQRMDALKKVKAATQDVMTALELPENAEGKAAARIEAQTRFDDAVGEEKASR